jgi:hypothetical protein
MTAQDAPPARGDQDHPSPHREKASLLALWTGLALAPLTWFVQLSIETPLLSQACYPRDEPYQGALPGLSLVMLAVDAISLVLALAGLFVAWRTWRRTSREKPGKGRRLLASGDGRSRFMAMAGILTSGLVVTAMVYVGVTHLLLRGCGQ